MAARLGSSGAASFGRTTNVPTAAGLFTVMGWVKLSADLDTWATFFHIGGDGSDDYMVMTDGDGTTLRLHSGGAAANGSTLAIGAWNHVAMVLSANGAAGGFTAYLNGVSNISVNPGAAAPARTPPELNIGTNEAGEFLSGCVYGVKVWDAALTAAEIRAEMNAAAPLRLAGINSWFPFQHKDDVYDYSGNGRHLTASGTLTTEEGPGVRLGFGYPTHFRRTLRPRPFAPGLRS